MIFAPSQIMIWFSVVAWSVMADLLKWDVSLFSRSLCISHCSCCLRPSCVRPIVCFCSLPVSPIPQFLHGIWYTRSPCSANSTLSCGCTNKCLRVVWGRMAGATPNFLITLCPIDSCSLCTLCYCRSCSSVLCCLSPFSRPKMECHILLRLRCSFSSSLSPSSLVVVSHLLPCPPPLYLSSHTFFLVPLLSSCRLTPSSLSPSSLVVVSHLLPCPLLSSCRLTPSDNR